MLNFNTPPRPSGDTPLLSTNSGVSPFMATHARLGVSPVGDGLFSLLNFNSQASTLSPSPLAAAFEYRGNKLNGQQNTHGQLLNFNTTTAILIAWVGVLKFNKASTSLNQNSRKPSSSAQPSQLAGTHSSLLKFNTLPCPPFAEGSEQTPCRADRSFAPTRARRNRSLNFNTPLPPGDQIQKHQQSGHRKRWLECFWGQRNRREMSEHRSRK